MPDRSIPPGFDENPTAWPRRILLAALALAGLCVSVYLTLFQIEVISGVWDPFFRSPKVLTFLGIPDAALGALAYATEIILLSIGGRERWRTMPWTVLALGVVILSGAIVSVLLILMQASLVDAWCTLCLASAAISLAIFGLGYDEPLAGLRHLKQVRDSGGSPWRALWGMEAGGKGGARMPEESRYPPIADYALIADSNSTALVSRDGSIDWCCIQRLDAGSCFGRLLDRERGGFCSIAPKGETRSSSRRYLEATLVLETTFEAEGGEARLIDCYTLPADPWEHPYRQILRVVEGVSGVVELDLEVAPRFDYGSIEPWLRQEGVNLYSAIGGNDGLLISTDADISASDNHTLKAKISVHAGERVRLSILSVPPEKLDYDRPEAPDAAEIDRRLDDTISRWRERASGMRFEGPYRPGVLRSALVIKALMNDQTGAVAAAPTTSLPESPGGEMNWDYRYSWIRDSFFSVRSLTKVGFDDAADRFRRFIERSAAGSAESLQLMYGVGGERRLTEETLDYLEGYRGARPVRVGNAAAGQLQLDMYGELLELSWRWHRRGNSPDDNYWRFLLELVDAAAERWSEPDQGLWELRGDPKHFVHSKVMCWAALDRGLRLAEECLRKAPERRWKQVREEIRESVETEGYDADRGVFTQAFGNKDLDAALLLLPRVDFVDYRDERMVRTVEAVREDLDDDGLLKRYRSEDVREGAFLACSFWLAECLAHQGRVEDARMVFDRTLATANDLDLFSEEYDTRNKELLGNFPQGLTHLSHISAAVAIAEHRGA